MKIFLKVLSCFLFILVITTSVLSLSCTTNSNNDALNLYDTGPYTLDPAISGEMRSHNYIMNIFSGLVYLDNDLKIQPDIAESWIKSEDGKTYTFKLRKGVTFHNGKEVTAEDFKYSWERACNPKTGSDTASMYLNDFVGADEVLSGKTDVLRGVEVADKYTLKVTINAPKAYFLAKMAYPTAYVVDKENVESGADWWRFPNGTGPYKLKEWITDQKIVLEANPNFYRQKARIKTINFLLLAGQPMDLYELDEIDMTTVSEYYIDKAKDPNGNLYKDLHAYPQLSFSYIGFNVEKPPFDDINIRKAFCLAVNKNKINKIILKDMVTDADGIIPPGMPGYNPDSTGFEFNVAKAKELIAASKYSSVDNFPSIKINTLDYGNEIDAVLGAIIQDWRNNLGVEVTVRQLEPEVYFYKLYTEADEAFSGGWVADYPDPQDFLDNLFHSGYSQNSGKYSNPAVDELLDKAAVEPDETKRLSMYQEAEQGILNDAACLPLFYDTSYVLIKPYVKNYKLNAMGVNTLSEVYLER